MGVDNDYKVLSQYCAANFEESSNRDGSCTKLAEIRNEILNNLENINYKISPLHNTRFSPYSCFIGFTPLHFTVRTGDIIGTENLIKQGANFTVKNVDGQTALHQIVHQVCLYVDDVPVTHWISRGKLFTRYIHSTIISKILSAHVDYNIVDIPCDEYGISHFHIACMTNNAKAVEFFLKHGISVNETVEAKSKVLPGCSPLHIAARFCALKIFEILLDFGADVNVKNKEGMTVLQLLIERNIALMDWINMDKSKICHRMKMEIETNKKMINLLLVKYADHDCNGLSQLQIACIMQDSSKVQQLLEECPNLEYNVSKDSNVWPGYTALHFAAHFSIDIVKQLLQKGANILVKDAKGVTPFDLCMEKYKVADIHSLLIDQPNFSNIKFSDENTKLCDFIGAMQEKSLFESFLQKISDINIYIPLDSPLWPGFTPLHLAVAFEKTNKSFEDLKDFLKDTTYLDVEDEEDSEQDSDKDEDRLDDENETRNNGVPKPKVDLSLERIKLCLKKGANVCVQNINGSSPLHLAFHMENKKIVKCLLKFHKKAINPVNNKNLSHLHIAVSNGDTKIAKKLLKADRASVNLPIKFNFQLLVKFCYDEVGDRVKSMCKIRVGSTPLHIAILTGNFKMAKILLDFGANIYAEDDGGWTPLHRLIEMKSSELWEFADFLESIEYLEDRVVESVGLSHLHVAILADSIGSVEALLEQGANIELPIAASESMPFLNPFNKIRPLQLAVKIGHPDIAQLLIDREPEIFADNIHEAFRFHFTDGYYFECKNMFITALQGNVTLRQSVKCKMGITVLHLACSALDVDIAKEALDGGDNVNAQIHKDSPLWPGCSPLHIVVNRQAQNDIEKIEQLVKLLLAHDADVTLMDNKHETPIHQCLAWNPKSEIENAHILDWLLKAQKNFNVNPASEVGISHLHLASIRDCEEVVSQFLQHGVDINCQIDYLEYKYYGGHSPFHLALIHGSTKIRDLLLVGGTDVELADRLGDTPLHVAIRKRPNNFELFEKIISAGADVMAKNVYGVSPFEMLLESADIPTKIFEMCFQKNISVNTFNPVSGEGYIGKAFYAISINEEQVEMKPVFEMMMERQDLNVEDDMGRNAIHNIIATTPRTEERHHRGCNTINYYTMAIERLSKIGCDIDHQDKHGRTPLHIATQLANYEAIMALFNCGVDVNIVDKDQKPALAYVLEYGEDKNMADKSIFRPYYCFMSLLSSFGFYLSEENCRLYLKARGLFQWNAVMMPRDCKEMDKLKEWKIGSLSTTLYDLLRDESVYMMMKSSDRLVVDEIFQSGRLRDEVPNTVAFLILSYRKAQALLTARLALIEPAKASLNCLALCQVPDLCAQYILEYLTNDKLTHLIESSALQ